MRNLVRYHNKVYIDPKIDEKIEYVCEIDNKIKQRDSDVEMNRV